MTKESWIVEGPTGISSKTIWAYFMGFSVKWASTPSDPDDFLRCYWLLTLAPEWESQIGQLGIEYPKWKPLTDNWCELKAMLELAWPKSCAKIGNYDHTEPPARVMYERMKSLLYGASK